MHSHLCITVRWIYDRYYGLTEDKKRVEWPPSPLRLFQSLVSGAYQHGIYGSVLPALEWIQRQPAPEILAMHNPNQGVRFDHYLPDNDQAFDHEKPGVRTFQPVLLEGQPSVHYVWRINADDAPPVNLLDELASTVSTLGCGIDQAFAVAKLARVAEVDETLLASPRFHRFAPVKKSEATIGTLRVPKNGSLDDLRRVFNANRIASTTQHERRKKRWPLVFDRIIYSGISPFIARPVAVFKLLDENEDPARYPHAKLVHIAGMVRHVAIETMRASGADAEFVNRFVRGKRDPSSDDEHKQISYVPLPSIGHQYADGIIRNVMLVAPVGMERELADVAQRIDGLPLKPEGEFDECKSDSSPPETYRAELRLFTPPKGKFIDTCYLGTSRVWHSVTPVILDGHNDKKPEKTIKLIQTALQRAGIETPCKFTWQAVPFLNNCLSAHKYDRYGQHTGYHRPAHLKNLTAVHVSLTFEHPLPGPITIGAGRHCGFGLFAAIGASLQ